MIYMNDDQENRLNGDIPNRRVPWVIDLLLKWQPIDLILNQQLFNAQLWCLQNLLPTRDRSVRQHSKQQNYSKKKQHSAKEARPDYLCTSLAWSWHTFIARSGGLWQRAPSSWLSWRNRPISAPGTTGSTDMTLTKASRAMERHRQVACKNHKTRGRTQVGDSRYSGNKTSEWLLLCLRRAQQHWGRITQSVLFSDRKGYDKYIFKDFWTSIIAEEATWDQLFQRKFELIWWKRILQPNRDQTIRGPESVRLNQYWPYKNPEQWELFKTWIKDVQVVDCFVTGHHPPILDRITRQ